MAGRLHAQVLLSATLATDYRYRGVSESDGRPALSIDLSYDRSGAYVGGALVAGRLPGSGLGVIGWTEFAGYARRLGRDVTLDVGASHARYEQEYPTYRYTGSNFKTNTEAYVGIRTANINYYVYYSPRYFGDGARTIYAEADPSLRLRGKLRLFGHLGVLTPLDRTGPASPREQYDARAGLAARFGRGDVELAWSSTRPGVSPGMGPRRDALVLSATCSF